MRAVLDANVVISALLSPRGTRAKLLCLWLDGAFELVVSPSLLSELERALAYPKLRRHIRPMRRPTWVDMLRREADTFDDIEEAPAVGSPDPGDDYVIALSSVARAVARVGRQPPPWLGRADSRVHACGLPRPPRDGILAE